MLSTLITSKARRTLLTLFLTHPEERFYQKQLIEDLGISSSLVQKELARLEEVGLLESTREGNIRFFSVNQSFPLYPELKAMIYKTVGLADFLRSSLEELEDIKAAFIYGSVAKNVEDAQSDIDLLVIGEVDIEKLHEAVSAAEYALGREVNYSVFDPADWTRQLAAEKAFVTDVARGPKVFLVGDEDEPVAARRDRMPHRGDSERDEQ